MKGNANLFVKLASHEILVSDGASKYLFAAMFFNIPVWGFIPYLTQVFTIILLAIFWKHHIINEEKQREALKNNEITYKTKRYVIFLLPVTMLIQAIWIPFVLQFITLALLGIIYATMTKYKTVKS